MVQHVQWRRTVLVLASTYYLFSQVYNLEAIPRAHTLPSTSLSPSIYPLCILASLRCFLSLESSHRSFTKIIQRRTPAAGIMRTSVALSLLSLAVATYAQDACQEVAAAIPTCAVSLFNQFNVLIPMSSSDNPCRFPASLQPAPALAAD